MPPWRHCVLFTAASEAVGHPVHTCLMVGDNPDADVAGARAAGMHAVLLDRSRASSAEKRDLSTISTLHELIQRILGKRTVEWTA
ncbi:hypothetical protein FEF26_04495 [Nesterenkonia salmonea]|uniref:HAD family hydrolase n=2 Tax=Nesterenkonia salmonea TaxID=1804987 RepID=A0A5R9BDM7_9MICC|nr:hypothetical protein FEF26_04495 [Nesterenkonia salmonea]